MRNSQPELFCFTANEIPEVESFTMGVSDHEEAEYGPPMLTGIVALYAVIVVVAACAVPTENVEARITTRISETNTPANLWLETNIVHFGSTLGAYLNPKDNFQS